VYVKCGFVVVFLFMYLGLAWLGLAWLGLLVDV